MSIKAITLDNLSRAINKLKDYFVQIKDAVLTVNGEGPNADGNVQITRVDYAGDIESVFSQTSTGEFIQRTSGGTASIETGTAFLSRIMGHSVHIGHTPEVIQPTITPSTADIEISINKATFRTAVTESGTITLTYTSSWSEDPATYGITVTGTPANGDTITIVYTKEVLGTIYNATPSAFVSTGWNLYNHTDGYAKVVRYSDAEGYRIMGAGSTNTLYFSTTPTGTRSAITVTSGLFNPPSDGYVHVTNGDSSTTAIYPIWSDWESEPYAGTEKAGTWEAYTATTIDLSTVMGANFPNGMFEVDTTRDEINLSLGQAISRIERMTNDDEGVNLAAAEASGRAYTYDTDYIYLVRATPVTTNIEIDGSYSADDHGIEYFEDTEVAVKADTYYGANLKNKLERDVLTISQQTLTAEQKAQVQTNIGLATANNLTTTVAGYALDARQGKTLKDSIVPDSYTASAYSSDLNNLKTGTVYCSSSAANAPTAHNYYIMSFAYGSSSGFQIAWRSAATTAFFRTKSSSGWTAWKQFAT